MLDRLRVVTSHAHTSRTVTAAFAKGSRTPAVHAINCDLKNCDTVVMYGLLRGLLKVWKRTRDLKKDWIYIDNGYINSGHFDGYYSVTVNAFQCPGTGIFRRGEERFGRLKMKWALEPPKRNGRHILVLPPTHVFGSLVGINAQDWLKDTLQKLRSHSDRPIVVREKPGSLLPTGKRVIVRSSLDEDLKDCYAVVTYNSKAAIECLVKGYRIFTSTKNCAYDVASHDLATIDDPWDRPELHRWLWALAAQQFTLTEMETGYCLEVLREDLNSSAVPHLPPDEKLTHFFG